MIKRVSKICGEPALAGETASYERILDGSLPGLAGEEICSHGYVVDTLEAAVWCLLNNPDFPDTVLSAVNLGGDSDTRELWPGAWLGFVMVNAPYPGIGCRGWRALTTSGFGKSFCFNLP